MPAGNRKLKKAGSAKAPSKPEDPLFPSAPRSFRIGGDVQPTRDMSRFVRWPKYVRIQRQRKVLYQRLKVPPSITQFTKPLDRAEAMPVFKLLAKYRPETRAEKKDRLVKQAEAKAAGGDGTGAKPFAAKFGLSHVTYLVEQKKAKLVVIACDVNPIELVVWLSALCRKMEVPYVIVNNKGRLGTLVHQKKAAVVALTEVRQEDKAALDKIAENAVDRFAKTFSRKWGGGIMGLKTQRRIAKCEAAIRAEADKKALY
jgi:large subunit ribosomal protein L7Ae